MKGELYNPGQPLKKEDLDHEKFSIQDAISDRLVDTFTSGVLYNSQLNGEARPFEITNAGGLFINVGTGVALAGGLVDSSDPTETGGERIYIPVADVGVGDNYQRSPGAGPGSGTGTGPFNESDDGLGGWYATPQSTLTRLIPVVDAATNYIWLGYLHAIDESVFSLHKATSGKIYPKGIDGYDIIVTQSASVPVFNGNANYQLLGTVVTAGGAITAISQTAMAFARMRPNRAGIVINTATPPATYSNGQTKFLDDHINAMGSGPGPSVNNPHNQTVEDLGLPLVDADLKIHRKNHHTKGLIGSTTTNTSNLFPRTDNSTPVGGDIGMVFCKQLISGEELVLDGKIFTQVTPVLLAPVGGGSTGDAYVSFPVALTAGVYTIFVKIVGALAVLDKRLGTSLSDNEYLVATVDWDGLAFTGAGGPPNVTSDGRLFGLTGTKDIQVGAVTTSRLADLAVTEPKIGPAAITASKMAVDSVATASIQALAVTTAKLDAAAVTDAKLATDAVTTPKIIANAVTEPKVATDAIESRQVADADGTSGQDTTTGAGIKTNHIQNGAVTLAKLSSNLQGAISAGNSISSNLVVEGVSVTGVTITAATLSVQSVMLNSVSLSASITASGVNGLDAGAEAASTWYAIFVITDDAGSIVASLLSTSPTSPTLPVGYTKFRRVGWVRNNASSNFITFTKTGTDVIFHNPFTLSSLNPAGTTSFAAFYPPATVLADFHGVADSAVAFVAGGGHVASFSMRTDSGSSYLEVCRGVDIASANGGQAADANTFRFRLTSSQTADVLSGITGANGGSYTLYATGYVDAA